MTNNLKELRAKLEAERKKLETELSSVATKDPQNPKNWDPMPAERDVSSADDNLVADSIENFEENTAITGSLEARLGDVLSALERMDREAYGTCQICGKEIEEDRLEANPAAKTCKEHIESL